MAVLAIAGRLSISESLAASLLILAGGGGLGWVLARRAGRAAEPGAADEDEEETPPYARLIDALPDPVLLVSAGDADELAGRRYILANRAAREVLRLQQDSGVLVTAIRDPDVLEAVDEALFGGVAAQAVYAMGGAQDRVLTAFAQPLGAGARGRSLALLFLRDETDVRRAERTRADFLANASHELRTPLASLSGFIETLRGHARTDEAAREKFLGIMQAQAERMSRLIGDLLSLSRIELNEHIPPHGETDLSLAVMDVIDSLGPLARDRQVVIDADLPAAGAAVITGDRDQIVQVAQNLIDNAVKYSACGGHVRVSLETGVAAEMATAAREPDCARMSLLVPDRGPQAYAVLRVSDQGRGMAREHLPRLTERFYRVEGQKSGDRSGTGLGLAIVKHIVNRHRGGLAVETAEGKGTTFTAYFPMSPAPPANSGSDAFAKLS